MKKRTKLLRALILTLALVICLGMLFTSCGDDEEGTAPTMPITPPTTAPTKPVTPPTSSTGTTDPSQGTTDPSQGTTDPSQGTTDPSQGTTDPSQGTTDPSQGTTDTSNNKPEDEPCTEHKGGTATCTKKAECEVCGEEYGDFADHAYGAWETVTEATCTADGEKKQTCSACGDVKTEVIFGMHDYVGTKCAACGEEATATEIVKGDNAISVPAGRNGVFVSFSADKMTEVTFNFGSGVTVYVLDGEELVAAGSSTYVHRATDAETVTLYVVSADQQAQDANVTVSVAPIKGEFGEEEL